MRRVSYKVEPTRVGQVTDYDKLLLTVETNGTVSPEDAVALAARILQDQLQLFINFEEPRELRHEEPPTTCRSTATSCARWTTSSSRCAAPTA